MFGIVNQDYSMPEHVMEEIGVDVFEYEKFDYAKAIAELDEIAAKVENPETKLDDIDALVGRSKELLKQCKDYLRTVKEKIDSLDKE